MIKNKKIIVVLPARNVEKTLKQTYKELPKKIIDDIILVDNKSRDNTVKVARELKIYVHRHTCDRGYGGSQKTLYRLALVRKADIVIMVHPDYQYDASRLPALIKPILQGKKDMMFGSRMSTRNGALNGGMPFYKFIFNRLFCLMENAALGVRFSEHFSGFRAYDKIVLRILPVENFSDDYIFDQQLMISAIAYHFRIGEIAIPTRYFSAASSIGYWRGIKFLWEILSLLILFQLNKLKVFTDKIFRYEKIIT